MGVKSWVEKHGCVCVDLTIAFCRFFSGRGATKGRGYARKRSRQPTSRSRAEARGEIRGKRNRNEDQVTFVRMRTHLITVPLN